MQGPGYAGLKKHKEGHLFFLHAHLTAEVCWTLSMCLAAAAARCKYGHGPVVQWWSLWAKIALKLASDHHR